ncbi:MAG: wax ester/triacylglycerol synthase family O-acyltransferase [Rhodocyclaceae bacterium]|nr:wax ester/triacylglycerol synthase family O-acyltransferase [Rhodocyclaceae bacterium]
MIKIGPLDMVFLLIENATLRAHMTAFMIFEKPKGQQASFGPRLVEAYRKSEAAKPFNYKLKWLDKSIGSWETVEPDMNYHVRHIAIPGPGSMKQFYETVSFLNTSLLDRGHPLWECYVIDGIEHDRIAVMIKVHHALIDGEGGMRVMRNCLSDSVRNKRLAAPWMAFENAEKVRRPRPSVSQVQKLQGVLKRLTSLSADLIGFGNSVFDMGAQSMNLKPRMTSLPFAARYTLFNNTPKSAARAYANMELPLDQIKAIAKATGTSVNDVVMTLIDDALHHYLREQQAATDKPLVAFMPMSMRDESSGEGGNQVTVELIAMGEPKAGIRDRLSQIHAATQSAKEKGRGMRKAARQGMALVLTGVLTMADNLPLFGKRPSANLVISNMKGPSEQLYLGGAPMVAFHGLPILPPGAGLNVTFASVNKDICLAIGAAPEAVREPYRIAELIEQAFRKLRVGAGTTPSNKPSNKPPNTARRTRKTA